MKIVNIPLHMLTPYEHNAKFHPVSQLESIAQSIKRFGFLQPIVVDRKGVIVAGHGRYEAAAALGMNDVLCVIAEGLTEDELKAYRLLDNLIAQKGSVDIGNLNYEISALPNFDFSPFNIDIPPLKETQKENQGLDRTDDRESRKENGKSQRQISNPGDAWILGEHQLLCGYRQTHEVDQLIKYWQAMTGKQAYHELTHENFDDVRGG